MTGKDRAESGFTERFDHVSAMTNTAFATVGAVAMIGIMVVTVGNMLLRSLGMPFAGAFEVVGWLAAVANGLAVGYTQVKRGHVEIDVLTRLMTARTQAVLRFVLSVVAMVLFAVVTWRMAVYGLRIRAVGTVSDVMRVTYYPFPLFVSLGFAGLTLALAVDSVRSLIAVTGRSSRAGQDSGSGDDS